jgi:hypothetical protein
MSRRKEFDGNAEGIAKSTRRGQRPTVKDSDIQYIVRQVTVSTVCVLSQRVLATP